MISVGCGGITFNREDNQLIGARRSVCIPKIFQYVVCVQEITRPAPGGKDIDEDYLPAIQVFLDIVNVAVDICEY
jgi:hypothetical protein